ncbi:MAG: hypothetical protein AAFY14_13375 [Pseudomonadota bacterium]
MVGIKFVLWYSAILWQRQPPKEDDQHKDQEHEHDGTALAQIGAKHCFENGPGQQRQKCADNQAKNEQGDVLPLS